MVLSLGCITFLWKSKIINKLINLLCLIGVSIPSFYIAIILLDVFAVKWDLLSVAGNIGITNYLLPAITLGIFGASFYYPLIKDALDFVRETYIAKLNSKVNSKFLSEYWTYDCKCGNS